MQLRVIVNIQTYHIISIVILIIISNDRTLTFYYLLGKVDAIKFKNEKKKHYHKNPI